MTTVCHNIVLEGYDYRALIPCTMAIAWIKGEENENYAQEMELIMQAIKENGYEYDNNQAYMIEVYNQERFAEPTNRVEQEVVLYYYTPCTSFA